MMRMLCFFLSVFKRPFKNTDSASGYIDYNVKFFLCIDRNRKRQAAVSTEDKYIPLGTAVCCSAALTGCKAAVVPGCTGIFGNYFCSRCFGSIEAVTVFSDSFSISELLADHCIG